MKFFKWLFSTECLFSGFMEWMFFLMLGVPCGVFIGIFITWWLGVITSVICFVIALHGLWRSLQGA